MINPNLDAQSYIIPPLFHTKSDATETTGTLPTVLERRSKICCTLLRGNVIRKRANSLFLRGGALRLRPGHEAFDCAQDTKYGLQLCSGKKRRAG